MYSSTVHEKAWYERAVYVVACAVWCRIYMYVSLELAPGSHCLIYIVSSKYSSTVGLGSAK